MMALQRWKLTIEYNGTGYAGWQLQTDGAVTVQEVIETAIQKFSGIFCRLHAAGRTDAGVHAHGQVAHFDLDYGDRPLDGYMLMKALNAHLGHGRVAIIKAEKVSNDFHARFGAINKLYTYRILSRVAPPTFDKNLVWWMRRDIDINLMQEGANFLLGTHDFTTFRAKECQSKSPIKTIDRIDIQKIPFDENSYEIRFFVEGQSFLHHQIRNMVGTLIQVGIGKWKPTDVQIALESKDRAKGGMTAPASGLSLTRIDYSRA